MDDLIAEIERSQLDKYRVYLCEYRGHSYVDLRLWAESRDGPDLVPTKKGVGIPPRFLGEILQALERAQALCSERGLVD